MLYILPDRSSGDFEKYILKNMKTIDRNYDNPRAFLPAVNAFIINHIVITLSLGMSNDYKLAINEGGNMIRVGSIIFGER